MFRAIFSATRKPFACVAALAVFATVAVGQSATATAADEIVVTITKFKALDRADELSDGDFFARIRINGKAAFSPVLTGKAEYTPNWKLTLPAKPGVNEVNLSLVDKDVSVDDPIDINRVDKKRDLDFTVNTKTGRIDGFNQPYKLGQTITRAGTEKKKATISFTVQVQKKK